MKKYKLWDTVNKSYLWDRQTDEDLAFRTKAMAEYTKDNYLAMGYYPDRPHTVIEIVEINTAKNEQHI